MFRSAGERVWKRVREREGIQGRLKSVFWVED